MVATQPVVVTGVGVVSAIGIGAGEFERSLREGTSGVGLLSEADGGGWVRVAARLKGFAWAGALERWFADEPASAASGRRVLGNTTDSTRWSVVAGIEACQDAGLTRSSGTAGAEDTALILAGSNLSQAYVYRNIARSVGGEGRINPRFAISSLDTNQLGCLSEILGLRAGIGWTTGGASASGNVALYQAWRMLRAGECVRCLVVGAGSEFSPAEFEAFAMLGAASTRVPDDGRAGRVCCPFDQAHSGFVWGEGAGALMLETAASAQARGQRVWGEVLGASVVLDGTHLPEPSTDGEARAMERALSAAGLGADRLDLLNAHGSGSPLGDRTECAALRRVLGDAAGRVPVQATKAMTGHCLGASGVLEAVACLVQMRGRYLHPNPHLDRPIDNGLRWAGPTAEPGPIRYALSNGFGFGGINSSVVLGAPRQEPEGESGGPSSPPASAAAS